MIQVSARLRVIGRELQGVTEIFACFGNFAGSGLKHPQIVPVICIIGPQMERHLLLRNRLLQLPGAGQRLREQRVQIRIIWRKRDRLPVALSSRIVLLVPIMHTRPAKLLVGIRVLGALLGGGLEQLHSLLRLVGLESQVSQVVERCEIMRIDCERGAETQPPRPETGLGSPARLQAHCALAASAGHCASMVRNCCSAALA